MSRFTGLNCLEPRPTQAQSAGGDSTTDSGPTIGGIMAALLFVAAVAGATVLYATNVPPLRRVKLGLDARWFCVLVRTAPLLQFRTQR